MSITVRVANKIACVTIKSSWGWDIGNEAGCFAVQAGFIVLEIVHRG